MWKPKLIVSNDKPKEPSQKTKTEAVIRRAAMLDSAPGSMFGDVLDTKGDIPANWPPMEDSDG